MLLNTGIQFSIIMYAILAGILTGAMFDLYRIIRGSNVNKVIIAIEDILFWILAAMIVFAFLLYTNYAFLGAYVYIFMILSLALYIRFISDICVKFELELVNILADSISISIELACSTSSALFSTSIVSASL